MSLVPVVYLDGTIIGEAEVTFDVHDVTWNCTALLPPELLPLGPMPVTFRFDTGAAPMAVRLRRTVRALRRSRDARQSQAPHGRPAGRQRRRRRACGPSRQG